MQKYFIPNEKRQSKQRVEKPLPAYQQMNIEPAGRAINPIEAREIERKRALLFQAEMQRKAAANKEAEFKARKMQMTQAAEKAKMPIPQSGNFNELQWNNAGSHKVWNKKTTKEELKSINQLEQDAQRFQTQQFRVEDIESGANSYNFEGIDLSQATNGEELPSYQRVENHYQFEDSSFDDEVEMTDDSQMDDYSFESLATDQYALLFRNEIYAMGSKESIENFIVELIKTTPSLKKEQLVIVKRVPFKIGVCVD